jgi:hypothetical protein
VVEALLTSGVHTICSNDAAFSADKTDGTVVAWTTLYLSQCPVSS